MFTAAQLTSGLRAGGRALALGGLAVGALAACTSSGGHPRSAGTGSPSSSPTARSDSPSIVVPATTYPIPTAVDNDVALIKQARITDCAAIQGGWQAKGTAGNRGGKALTYTITVFFTTTGGTDVSFAVTKVRVPPGKTVDFVAGKKFVTTPPMRCVLVGVAA